MTQSVHHPNGNPLPCFKLKQGAELLTDHAGLKAARRAVLPVVPWQRCQFHLQQNAGAFVTRQEAKKAVAAQLRAIFNAPDRTEAERSFKLGLQVLAQGTPETGRMGRDGRSRESDRL